jgi:uncharacterized membrane protein YbhN (UPF0104 family)
MWDAWRAADKIWFVAAFGAYAVVATLGSLRWHILLRVQNISLGYWRVLRLFMIGTFFNLFMFGTVGGDVVKAFYLVRESANRRAAALLSVLMDRLIGLLALIVLSVAIMGLQAQLFLVSSGTRLLFISVATILAGAVCAIVLSFLIAGLGLVHKLPPRLPGRQKIVDASAAYITYGREWRASLAAFALSLVAHMASFMIFFFAAQAFTASLSLRNIFTVMPVVNTITALPLSINGMGLREGVFEELLGGLYSVPTEIAVLVSLSGFMVIAVGSAVGGLAYLTYRSGEHVPLGSIARDARAVEEHIERP